MLPWKVSSCAAIAVVGISVVTSEAVADSIVAGTVTDAITERPTASIKVRVLYSGVEVGSSTTDAGGRYSVPFATPPTAPAQFYMDLSVSDGIHAPIETSFQVDKGNPITQTVDLKLIPQAIATCQSESKHSIIIGQFLSPADRPLPELPRRVAETLDFSLNTKLQSKNLAISLQPSFEPCELAQPKTIELGQNFARALRADAFVSGSVEAVGRNFTVSTYVSDAYQLFGRPVVTHNENVDIYNPSAAEVTDETHAAVLEAFAAGLAKDGDCVDALTVVSVAQQFVSRLTQPLSDLRKRCQNGLPNVGLLADKP